MSRNALRKQVARACALAVEKQHSDIQTVKTLGFESVEAFVDRAWPNYLPQADAAIAVVLESAAKVAEKMHRKGQVGPDIAAAIRAMIPKEKSK